MDWQNLKTQGNTAYGNKDFDSALDYYSQAIELNPNNEVLYNNKAAAYMMKHEYVAALEQCELALERNCKFVKALQRKARCEVMLLRLQDAYQSATKAVDYSTEEGEDGKLKESSMELMKLVDSVQNDVQSILTMIGEKQNLKDLLHEFSDNTENSSSSMQVEGTLGFQYSSIDPNFVYLWNPSLLSSTELAIVDGTLETLQNELYDSLIVAQIMTKSRAARGMYAQGSKTIQMWHQKFPDDPCVLYVMGLLERLNKLEKSQEYLEKALEIADNINADNVEDSVAVSAIKLAFKETQEFIALKMEGNTLFMEKRYEEAIDKYSTLINQQLNAIILSNRAQCNMCLGEHDVAIEDLEQSITVNSGFTKSIFRRAQCLKELGDLEAAKDDFKFAMNQDGKFETPATRSIWEIDQELKKARGEKMVDLDFKEEVEIEDIKEFDEIITNSGPKLVVVDFSATWCGPCKFIGPIYEEMAKQYAGKAIFLKVDVDESPDIASRYGVRSMPTFAFLKWGKMVHKFSGADQNTLAMTVNQYL